MERELVLEEELIAILNKELSKYKECDNCRFISIFKLAEEDKDGCNWSRAGVKAKCTGVPVETWHPFMLKIVTEIRKKYNIKK